MDVAVAGGHGQIARRLTRRLAARGDSVRGIIRSPEHADDLRDDGAQPILLDLEHAGAEHVAEAIEGCDAVVFAAGAGPGSGAARKETVDYAAAVATLEAAQASGVRRYVMISAMGAAAPPDGDEVFSVYLRAKARADQALADSDLDWTIVRPGHLTNGPGTGRVWAAEHVERGEIARDDVAEVVLAVLDDPRTTGVTFEVVSGDTPITAAVAGLRT